jgi:AraC-like DNA-binding protein
MEWSPAGYGWSFFRLNKGHAYWLGKQQTWGVELGDVMATSAQTEGRLRASQLAEAQVEFFTCTIDHFAGLLTLAERHAASALETNSFPGFLFRSDQPVAKLFEQIAQAGWGERMVQRTRMLQMMAEVCFKQASDGPALRKEGLTSPERFEAMIKEFSESELLDSSVEDLARECHCSTRHFRRLFRTQFGVSHKRKLTELRLAKARLLLANANSKIIDIAMESGYRHLGLFNTAFKKHVGVTPSAWRRKELLKITRRERGTILEVQSHAETDRRSSSEGIVTKS